MSFSVSEFKAKVDGNGGLSRSNLFMVTITKIPRTLQSEIGASDLSFFCKSTELPSLTLNTENYFNNGFGIMERRPVNMELPLLPTIFYIDSNHNVLKFFHAWMQSIINYDISAGIRSEVDGKLPYELGYKEDYVGEMEIKFFSSNDPEKFYTVKFNNVHPVEIGQVGLAWESNDELAMLPVSFSYETVQVDGAKSGIVSSRYSRGVGLFEVLSSINTTVQAIDSLGRPTSIQDAINKYTTVNNIVNNLPTHIERIF